MRKNPEDILELRVGHIEEQVEHASELVERGKELFDNDWVHRAAAKDLIETIGEAVAAIQTAYNLDGNNMPPPLDELEVPWRAMKRMRDRTTHGYHHVDWVLVWSTLETDLPSLGRALAAVEDPS